MADEAPVNEAEAQEVLKKLFAEQPELEEKLKRIGGHLYFADDIVLVVLKGHLLIEEALTNGYDIRIIAKRVEQARYAVGVTRADLLPQASYQGSAQRGKVFNPFGGDNVTGNNFFAALQMAWEIDVWGRIRRATEASLADLVAAEDVRRGVILSLVTGVSQAYFELRELDLEMEIALRTRDSFQQTLDLQGEPVWREEIVATVRPQ